MLLYPIHKIQIINTNPIIVSLDHDFIATQFYKFMPNKSIIEIHIDYDNQMPRLDFLNFYKSNYCPKCYDIAINKALNIL